MTGLYRDGRRKSAWQGSTRLELDLSFWTLRTRFEMAVVGSQAVLERQVLSKSKREDYYCGISHEVGD
jgi:hypothetical protein